MSLFSFRKDEILRKKKLIDRLFAEGQSFFAYPFKVVFLENPVPESAYPVQILISVGKRSFKNAVDRNRVKRLIREGYRRHKHQLYEHLANSSGKYMLALVYTPGTIMPATDIELKIKHILSRLCNEIDPNLNNTTFPLSDK